MISLLKIGEIHITPELIVLKYQTRPYSALLLSSPISMTVIRIYTALLTL